MKQKQRRSFAELYKDYGIYVVLAVLVAILSILRPSSFFTVSNLINVLRQCSVYAILAFGMTYIFIGDGLDLSVGNTLNLCSCIVSMLMVDNGMNMWLAVLITLCVGVFVGFCNAFIVTKLKVNPFLGTLGTMYIIAGVSLYITNENPITGLPEEFQMFGGSLDWISLPPQFIIAVVLFVILYIVLQHTKLGRHVYAVGSNGQAARLSGIKVTRIKFFIFMLSGFCAALSGVIMASRLQLGSPVLTSSYEMDAIAAVCIGGTSSGGGDGSLGKTVCGALTLTVIRVGLNILRISTSIQQIVIGSVIVGAVAIDMYGRSRRE